MFDGILPGCHIPHPDDGIWNGLAGLRVLHQAFDAEMGEADELEQGEPIVGPELGKLVGRGHLLTAQLEGDLEGL
jgi:hypothetical protein